MSTMETRTGYGNHHHKACDCHDCGTDRLVADLTSRLWTGYESEDLDTPAPAPVASPGGLTVPWVMSPEPRADVQKMRFEDLDDGGAR